MAGLQGSILCFKNSYWIASLSEMWYTEKRWRNGGNSCGTVEDVQCRTKIEHLTV